MQSSSTRRCHLHGPQYRQEPCPATRSSRSTASPASTATDPQQTKADYTIRETMVVQERTTTDETFQFDYEDAATVEGRGELRTGTRDLAALRLERCLDAIEGTAGKLLEIGCGA